jgi:hypothetical protein
LENVKIGLSDLKRRHCEVQYGHPISTGKKAHEKPCEEKSAKKRTPRKERKEKSANNRSPRIDLKYKRPERKAQDEELAGLGETLASAIQKPCLSAG